MIENAIGNYDVLEPPGGFRATLDAPEGPPSRFGDYFKSSVQNRAFLVAADQASCNRHILGGAKAAEGITAFGADAVVIG